MPSDATSQASRVNDIEADGASLWDVAVVGGGPAGLAAAETAAAAGARVIVLEQRPSVGRKLLMAGKSGLNLTMDAPPDLFLKGYRGPAAESVRQAVANFAPGDVRAWADSLGAETFAGSSGKVFPRAMKASPLLRAWLARLEATNVSIQTRMRLAGLVFEISRRCWGLEFETSRSESLVSETRSPTESLVAETSPPEVGLADETSAVLSGLESETRGPIKIFAHSVILALGGANWPRLGSDGEWPQTLAPLDIEAAPFAASNVGWNIAWSDVFRDRFAGVPLKNIALIVDQKRVRGELIVTNYGIEGGPLYVLGPDIEAHGGACFVDLAPDRPIADVAQALRRPPGKATISTWLRKRLGLEPVKIGLLREAGHIQADHRLAERVKAVPLSFSGKRPIAEAISTSGGVLAKTLDAQFMLRDTPGVYCVGEMVDWDAPTGGYLLTACFAMGRTAGAAAARRAQAL